MQQSRFHLAVLLFMASLAASVLLLGATRPSAAIPQTALSDSPGPPGAACERCHTAIVRSYRQTSMARGSGPALDAVHAGSFVQRSSGVTYRIAKHNGALELTSARDTEPHLDDRQRLDYFIGAGKHGITYLFSRPGPGNNRLWYEAPVNWYTARSAYGMTPAYDNSVYAPLALKVDGNCLHCHTSGAGVQPASGPNNAFTDAPFSGSGIDCLSCHGNADEHLRSGGKTHMIKIGELAPAARDSICLQCHLEGDAMIQRAGRTLSAFKPGEDLADTAIYFVNASSPKSIDRASSQYEGMLRSACRRALGDRMTCTTCHDPHSSPPSEQRVSFYRDKCLACHTDNASFQAKAHHPEQPDCATCHMPSRATSDISHEQNVDHDIEAKPSSRGLRLTTLSTGSANVTGIHYVAVNTAAPGNRELGLAYAQCAARDRVSANRAVQLLTEVESAGGADALVHEQLGYLTHLRGNTQGAQMEYEAAIRENPGDPVARSNLAILLASRGDIVSARQQLSTLIEIDPTETATLLNLAYLECRSGDAGKAKRLLSAALSMNPDDPSALRFSLTGDYAGAHCAVH